MKNHMGDDSAPQSAPVTGTPGEQRCGQKVGAQHSPGKDNVIYPHGRMA